MALLLASPHELVRDESEKRRERKKGKKNVRKSLRENETDLLIFSFFSFTSSHSCASVFEWK
jgi:hypothetical protein